MKRIVAVLGVALLGLAGCSGPDTEPSEETRTAGPTSTAEASPTPGAGATSSPSARATPSASASPRTASPTAPAKRGKPDVAKVTTGLTSPWAMLPLAGGDILVTERDTGKIKLVSDGKSRVVRTLDQVRPAGEGGLLGLAITRDTKTVFAYFTAGSDNRIVAMSWDGRRLGSPDVILDGIPKGTRHNGGRMVVGPDDRLYVGTGEVGQTGLAQQKDSLGGKILRLTLRGNPAPGNPFDNEVYSYGHRNVEGLAFDDEGRLWASEFGDQTWDELNLIREGGNYGWPRAEGKSKTKGLINPKLVWKTSEASPAGLAFWQGELWMAALRGQRLWEIPLDGNDTEDPKDHYVSDYGRLRSVAPTADGKALLLSTSNTDGRLEPKSGDDRVLRLTR